MRLEGLLHGDLGGVAAHGFGSNEHAKTNLRFRYQLNI